MTLGAKKAMLQGSFLRLILICIGWLSVAAGIVGIFLPLVPTVPFLLLAAACFSRSSERFHGWLLKHKRLGPLLHDYLQGTGIPLRAKVTAIGMVWVSFLTSAFIFVQVTWFRVLLLAIASGITVYLLGLPTLQPDNRDT